MNKFLLLVFLVMALQGCASMKACMPHKSTDDKSLMGNKGIIVGTKTNTPLKADSEDNQRHVVVKLEAQSYKRLSPFEMYKKMDEWIQDHLW